MKLLQIDKPLSKLLGIMLFGLLLTACQDDNSPGVEFMPDMYRSPAIEPFVDYVFVDSATSLLPPEHSIPQGYLPFPYENTLEDFERAGEELEIPFPVTEKILKDGEVLYARFCAHCHGAEGDGAGTITHAIYSAVPSYTSDAANRRGGRSMKELTAGHIYHTIMYGLNAMGPHATLIRETDRWKIVAYVESLQGKDVLSATDGSSAEADSVTEDGGNSTDDNEQVNEEEEGDQSENTDATASN